MMHRWIHFAKRPGPLRLLIALLALSATVRSAPADDAHELFEARIRPVLVEHCYECHSASSEPAEGGLWLDTRAGMQKGGNSGPVVLPGKVESSRLIRALRYQDDALQMPPSGKLPEQVIRDFETWVAQGAIDPRDEQTPAGRMRPTSTSAIDLDAGKQYWAFRPLRHTPIPAEGKSWSRDPLDRFVAARLQRAGLAPAARADRRTRIRRLYFDLTGLPPAPDQVASFCQDPSPDAWTQRVDDLLSTRVFAEHWARHWLDIVRYADSNGNDFNATYHQAWRYRNYTIDAFAADKPFDQMVREQIAGDLLPYANNTQRASQLVATGFLTLGPKMLSERDKLKLRLDVVDEQIDTYGKSLLGLTLGCARCHDHKFDPIASTDYYALAGIFWNAVTLEGEIQQYVSDWVEMELPITADHMKRLAEPAVEVKEVEPDRQNQLAPPPLPRAMTVREVEPTSDIELRVRGIPSQLGPVVPRGFLRVLANDDARLQDPSQSGRLELAHWTTSVAQPLLARVFVNRVWQHLIGAGIVHSCDNFGQLGDRPTHPELLDALAADFIAHGWSVKYLVRRIVLSQTYQMGVMSNDRAMAIDPENRLLWRAHRKRLTAEQLRDAMLAVSQSLDLTPGSSPVAQLGRLVNNNSANEAAFQQQVSFRRSVYLPVVRNELPDLLTVFDFADPDRVVGRRAETNVPAQALLLLNHPLVALSSERVAQRILSGDEDDLTRLGMLYQLIFQRDPRADEIQRDGAFLAATIAASDDASEALTGAWTQLCHALLASTEFRFLD